jgi:hypothetical protein
MSAGDLNLHRLNRGASCWSPITAEEQAYLDKAAAWAGAEGAYMAMHRTKPQTLAYALTDSPVGLALPGSPRSSGLGVIVTATWALSHHIRGFRARDASTGSGAVPARTADAATLLGRTRLQRPAMDCYAQRRAFCRVGAASTSGRGHPRLLPAHTAVTPRA